LAGLLAKTLHDPRSKSACFHASRQAATEPKAAAGCRSSSFIHRTILVPIKKVNGRHALHFRFVAAPASSKDLGLAAFRSFGFR
jgi:hypothetical protein